MAYFRKSLKMALSLSRNLKCASSPRGFCSHFCKNSPTASRIPSLKMAEFPSRNPRCASACRPFSRLASPISPFPELDSHVAELHSSLHRKVVQIWSSFVAPDNPEIHESHHIAAGICFDPTLVLTSAHVVGRVAAVKKPYGGSPLYRAHLGSTAARTYGYDTPLKLMPLAVSFASDVAVLKMVEEPDGISLPVLPLAGSQPEKESILMSETLCQEHGWAISLANVRAVGQKTIKAKAPWPLDDELAWLEHDWMVFYRGPPPPSSVLFNCNENVTGSVTKLSGSPWFNLHGELVGVASWVLRDDPASFSVGYGAPVSNVRPVIKYAKTKGPGDPVVMDCWISSEVVSADQEG